MTPSQARAFQAVAIEGSFTAAARSLGLSQPTVTNQVRLIELRYKVELFHRSSRGVRLTETGTGLLTFVRKMYGNYEEAVSYLQEARGMQQGHIRIGSYGPYGVILMIARFREQYPEITISIKFANSYELTKQLQNYDLDVAVMSSIEHHSEFHVLPFSSPLMIAIAPKTERWLRQHSISRPSFFNETLICREQGSAVRAAFDKLLGATKVNPNKIIEIGSREGVISAVAEGLGLAVVFDEGLTQYDQIVRLRISRQNISSHVDVICLADRRRNQMIDSFLKVASGIAAGHRHVGSSFKRP